MNGTPSNSAVADILERHGRLLEIAGAGAFRSRAYLRAAEAVRVYGEPLTHVAAEGRLREIPGVGEGIASAIEQILARGTFAAHEDLTSQFPEPLVELTTLPGVGAKTALKLFTSLGVDGLEALEAALLNGSIAATKGLGPRVEATIRDGLAEVQRRSGRIPLGVALPAARRIESLFSRARPADIIHLAGSARRWEVTVGDLDFVVATEDLGAAIAALEKLPIVASSSRTSASSLRLDLGRGLQADVFLTSPSSFGSVLVRATGDNAHLARLGTIPEFAATEAAVYATHDLPWIPPELRTGRIEFERPEEIGSLVTINNIQGEFHAHTTWSDGTASIHEMAKAAARRGYHFLGITDHSHGLGVAGGLDLERLAAQRLEIRAEDGVDGITLLAGAEVEVHRDGALDYDDETLSRLDVVVASLHTGLRQPREQLTDRLLRVLVNRNVDIIAHPSGRLIERREGGDFDWERVFAAAAISGTALEINADPARLDLDPHLARRAADAGCLITINCDAHSPDGFALMEYGVAMARRAWLHADQILNCWPLERILAWLSERRLAS